MRALTRSDATCKQYELYGEIEDLGSYRAAICIISMILGRRCTYVYTVRGISYDLRSRNETRFSRVYCACLIEQIDENDGPPFLFVGWLIARKLVTGFFFFF